MANNPIPSNVNNVLNDMGNSAVEMEEDSLDLFILNLQKKEGAQIASDKRVAQARAVLLKREFADRKKQIEEMAATDEEKQIALANLERELNEETINLAHKMEENFYKFSDKASKRKILNEKKATLEQGKLELKQRMAAAMADRTHNIHKMYEMKKLGDMILQSNDLQIQGERQKRNVTREMLKEKRKDGIITAKELHEQLGVISETYAQERAGHEEKIDAINEQIAAQEKWLEEHKDDKSQGAGLARWKAQQNIDELKEKKAEEKKAIKQGDKERFKEELLGNTMKAGFKGLENGLGKLGDKFDKAMDEAIDTVGQFKSGIDARLQGTQSSYEDVAKTMKNALAISPFVKQTEVLKKLNDAVEKGIAYNVEQRAFLGTMTDKIVSTFDALDDTLMRVIRLQQADTTAARMGMEASLLQFFNSTFSDSSYLSQGYDQVSQALVDANAQMTRDMSIAFEYNVQKWLGSLASLGFGTDTINTIAQGINYLGSGNVAALAGNTQLQSLLAMSASRAGLSYSELLVRGIDDSSVNTLLKSMVEYLAEIAEDNNAVVKAAYGDVFNFTQADLRAIKNIANDEGATINNIFDSTMTYADSMLSIQDQLNQVGSRLSMTEMINNVFDNFLYSSAESLARNPATAILWKTLTLLESVTGGIEIPFVNVYGFGLNLNMSVEQLMRTGMFGLSALSQVGNMISSISSGGGMDLGVWGGTEYTSRGGKFDSTVGGVQSTKSGSKTVTSGASSDTKRAAVSSTEEDQEDQKKQSKESMKDEITLETLYKEIFEKKSVIYVVDDPVNKNIATVVAATNAIHSKINDIHTLLDTSDTGVKVQVTNFSSMPAFPTMPKSMGVNSMSEDVINKLAVQIANGVLGKKGADDGDTSGIYTLSDLVNLLAYGTISVRDDTLSDDIRKLNADLI